MSGDNLVEIGPQISPAVIVRGLMDEIERCWRIRSSFSPGLDYDELLKNHKTDHLAESDTLDEQGRHPLIDSLFAWNRTHVQSNQQVGDFTGVRDRYCADDQAIVSTAPGEFDLNFRGFFSDAQTLEVFEIGYLTGKVLRNITAVYAERCDLDGNPTGDVEQYNLEWNPIDGIDWSLRESNWMSLTFSAKITGTFRCAMPQGDDFCLPRQILKFHFNALTD